MRSDPNPYPIGPDATGGYAIRDTDEKVLAIGHAQLQALDLVAAPRLESLRIEDKASAKELHLLLDDVPNLAHLTLPQCDHGAIIHLTGEAPSHPLYVCGPVRQIDAGWPGVNFLMECTEEQSPWRAVRIVAPDQVAELVPSGGLVIIMGQGEADPESLVLHAGDDWLLVGCNQLRQLRISGGDRVCIEGASELREVSGGTEATDLHINGVPSLSVLSGQGRHLSIRQHGSCAPELNITGDWQEVSLRCPNISKLSFLNAQSLRLFQCEQLRSVELPLAAYVECHGSVPDGLLGNSRLFMDESALARNIEAVRNGDLSQLDAMLKVLASNHQRDEVLTALQAMKALCEAGIDPQRIWPARQELLARHLSIPRRKRGREPSPGHYAEARRTWEWFLPEDQVQEGLRADLAIWVYCRSGCRDAARYTRALVTKVTDLSHLRALVDHGMAPGAERIDRTVMTQALQSTAQSPLSREIRRKGEGKTLARHLLHLIDYNRVDDKTRNAILDLFVEGLTFRALADTFEQLLPRYPTEIRGRAIGIAYAPDHWLEGYWRSLASNVTDIEQVRSTFLQMALRPVQDQATESSNP